MKNVIEFLAKHPDLDEIGAEKLICWLHLVGQGALTTAHTLEDTDRVVCDDCTNEGNCPLMAIKNWEYKGE